LCIQGLFQKNIDNPFRIIYQNCKKWSWCFMVPSGG